MILTNDNKVLYYYKKSFTKTTKLLNYKEEETNNAEINYFNSGNMPARFRFPYCGFRGGTAVLAHSAYRN